MGRRIRSESHAGKTDTNANPIDRVEVIRAYIVDRSQLGRPVQVK